MNNIEKLIADYRYKHPLAEKLGGEFIMQSDEAQIDAIQLVCDIFENAPLEQKPKTGHWINVEVWDKERYACSVCQVVVNREPCYHYCPYCGAEMIEPKESEE